MCALEANEDKDKAIEQARETTQLSTRQETSDKRSFNNQNKKTT